MMPYVEDAGEIGSWLLPLQIPPALSKVMITQVSPCFRCDTYLATEIIHLMAKFFSEDNFSLVENEIRPSLVFLMVSKKTGEAKLVDLLWVS